MHSPAEPKWRRYLQGSGAFISEALDEIILGLSEQLLGFPPAVWEWHCSVSKVVEDCPKMFATAIDQDPTLGYKTVKH